MSAHTLCIGAGYPLPATADRSLSDSARLVREELIEASDVSISISLGEARARAREALASAYTEAREENWDGEGSAAADPGSYEYACSFLAMLPNSALVPEASIDPDGELSFEWYEGPRTVFSVSVGRDGTLTYAGLFGTSTRHGSEPFSDDLPEIITKSLNHFRAEAATQPYAK